MGWRKLLFGTKSEYGYEAEELVDDGDTVKALSDKAVKAVESGERVRSAEREAFEQAEDKARNKGNN